MSDFIFARKSRNALSTFLHIVLNILLGVGSIALTLITGSWILGVVLVLISKWRVFAVRPRYWFLNIKASLVDLIVGTSFVLIAYCAGTTAILPVHYILAILYTLWLIFLKPRRAEIATEAQALIAVFLGTTAAALICATLDSLWLSLVVFVIGYGAARHVLVQSNEPDFTLLSLICGLVAAEITWVGHSWLTIYSFGSTGILIPELALILTILGFLLCRVYRAITKRDGRLKFADIAVPAIFCTLAIAIMIIWFSEPIFNI